MSIIIISSDSYGIGRDMAKSTAEAMGYDFLGREILGRVTVKYEIPEERLIKALEEYPSFFGKSLKLWNRHLAYIQEAVMSDLLKDNLVCQGLAAHLYVLGVSHALRVHILSDAEESVRQLVSQEGISTEKARKRFNREKKRRRRWSMEAFNLDETDPSQYDLVISLSKIDPDEAVKLIGETISYRRFKPMTYSIKCIHDIELAARVRAALLERFPDVRVHASSGVVVVKTTALKREKKKRMNIIREIAGGIQGVEYVEVHVINDFFRQSAESFR